MKIAIAQISVTKGDTDKNIKKHIRFASKASDMKADIVFFPELSITGYEPDLAKELSISTSDTDIFNSLQLLSNQRNISICVGIPTQKADDLFVSMAIIAPQNDIVFYSKQYLYPSEVGVFTPAFNHFVMPFANNVVIAPAICYELSITEHHEIAKQLKANHYVATVMNSVNGVDADLNCLSAVAKNYNMTTFMSNYVGVSGGYNCAGKSSVFDFTGELIAQLDGKSEGLIIYDTDSKVAEKIVMEN